MNGAHDVGARHGFGPVVTEDETVRFHAEWERRVLGVTLAAGALGLWNLDASRHARESLPPSIYYNASYYEIWLRGLEKLLIQAGEVSPDELASGHAMVHGKNVSKCLHASSVPDVLAKGGPTDRSPATPRFGVGDRVRMRNHQPSTHTRLPAYVRGRVGVISAFHGTHVYPDSHANFTGEQPQPLYTVRFEATELYGEGADPTVSVSVEAWEPYLEQA